MPRDPYLAANLKQALKGTSAPEQVPLLDHIFFWQRSLSYGEKMMAVTGLLLATIVLALLRQLNWMAVAVRNICVATCVVLLLMSVSAARDWLSIEQTIHGVIVEDVVARKGGSTTYEPAFTQPLRTGTEFVLLETGPTDWQRIKLPGEKDGWIPPRAAVTY